jgi:4-amino-4-deoxy-L-arabinose transferase-like glycosyltransferase
VKEARLALNRTEWACVTFAVIVAHAFLVHEWFYPSAWDATSYVDIAKDIAERGLFRKFHGSDFRTYGYPFVLSIVLRAVALTGVSFVLLLFELQFIVYCGSAFLLRRALAPVNATAARIAFCALLVNYYALIYTPESLTESLSLTLLVLAAAAWVTLWRGGLAVWPLIAGSATVGVAFMVRPANAFMVAVWVVGFALLVLRERPPASRVALLLILLVAAVALPMAPQVRNNLMYYGTPSPTVSVDLGQLQQSLGAQNLKYATALPPVPRAPVYYNNPFYEGTTMDEAAPWSWYLDHPLRALATVALHTFNLTDQDLLFTYSRDLTPWYRVPLGIVNHAVVALGLVGLVLLGQRARTAKDPRWRDAYVMLLALIAANWAVYAWTAVEMRFGSVLLLVLFPLAGYAALRIAALRSTRKVRPVAAGIAAYVTVALLLSAWVRDQSPLIRESRLSQAGSFGRQAARTGCCAPATGAAARAAAPGGTHSHPRGFAG